MSSTDVSTKVMDKTNQLFLNLPNGTFLFLREEALINSVLCVASQKEQWLGDRISLSHCPPRSFVTVLRCPVSIELAHWLQDECPTLLFAHLSPRQSSTFSKMHSRLICSLSHPWRRFWGHCAAAESMLNLGLLRCCTEHFGWTPGMAGCSHSQPESPKDYF